MSRSTSHPRHTLPDKMFNSSKVTVDMGSGAASGAGAGTEPTISIRPEVSAVQDEMIKNRRWFHAHPELSFKEIETSAYVAAELRSYGITELWEKVGRTGVVALIRGGKPGPCVALRADMDALPIQETGDCPFISQNAGVMHACGHDGHMSMLLGAVRVLLAMAKDIKGTVKFIFQPAEEGFGGAREMIKEGVLNDGPFGPAVDAIYGAHLWSYDAVGKVGARHGPMMAASDKFEIDVIGKGGHGAAPQGTVDAVVVAANVVTALQTVISRNKDPLDAGVLTCGTINGGHGYNIIADKVVITGTCRSFTKETQALIEQRMKGVCCGIGAAYGASVDLHYHYGYPPTINRDAASVDSLHRSARKIVGNGAGVPYITCGAEDFAYFLEQKPGCFFFVGAALPGDPRPHHKSNFLLDEKSLAIGASVFVQLIDDLMISGSGTIA